MVAPGTPNEFHMGLRPTHGDVALMAVEDSNVTVRQWIAREGKHLDYREEVRDVASPETIPTGTQARLGDTGSQIAT
jgi:hypothetical protein